MAGLDSLDGRSFEVFAENPDIIILDLMLPEIDGLEVARTIRKDQQCADHCPICKGIW